MKNKIDVKQYLLQKMTEHWLEDNKGLKEDIEKLSAQIVFFNMKW